MALPWRRKVMLDTNVYYSNVHSPRGEGAKVVDKTIRDDDLQMTSINYDESLHAASRSEAKAKEKGKTSKVTRENMRASIDGILRRSGKKVERVDAPEAKTLQKKYRIRDEDDAKILYAAEKTGSEILVTGDKDFYQPDLVCPADLDLVKPREYVEEDRLAYELKKNARRFRK